ncbi:MAG: Ig-like domain-containing protein, partial [Chlorobiaceae bacterium]
VVASTANATLAASIVSGNTLSLDPTITLATGTHYYVTFTSHSIDDLAGNSVATTATYDFTTVAADTTPPALTQTGSAIPLAVTSNLDLVFSEAIARGTGAVELRSGSATGAVVASTANATLAASIVSGNTLHLDPTITLANGTHYYVTFTSHSIDDLAGNSVATTATYDFTTVAADTTPPALTQTGSAIPLAVTSNLDLVFSEAIARGTGAVELRSGSATGAVVASTANATLAASIVSGNTLHLDPTITLANGTHYYVTFTSHSIDDLAGNSVATTATYDFTTVAADTTPPALTQTGSAIPLAVTSNLDLVFSEAIARGTGAVELRSGSATGAVVASTANATLAASIVSGNTLSLDPLITLTNGTHYYVTFAPHSIDDLAGNSIDSNATYDFATAATLDHSGDFGVDVAPGVVGVGAAAVLTWALFF